MRVHKAHPHRLSSALRRHDTGARRVVHSGNGLKGHSRHCRRTRDIRALAQRRMSFNCVHRSLRATVLDVGRRPRNDARSRVERDAAGFDLWGLRVGICTRPGAWRSNRRPSWAALRPDRGLHRAICDDGPQGVRAARFPCGVSRVAARIIAERHETRAMRRSSHGSATLVNDGVVARTDTHRA